MSGSENDKWEGLREKLTEEGGFPKVYMFKFIIPNDHQKLARAEALFGPEAIVNLRSSKNGKYLSVSGKELMLDVETIIDRYKKAMEIEGAMAL